MARGSKRSYTGKQKRKAEKVAKSYKKRGVSAKEAKAPRLGHHQQGKRRRQEERLPPRQEDEQDGLPQRRQEGRRETQEVVPKIPEHLMKAVVFRGVGDIRIEDVPEPLVPAKAAE